MDGELSFSAASTIQQSKVHNQIATAIARKSQDVQRQQGQAVIELVQQVEQLAAQLAAGGIDVQL